jgi:adenine-specific DNA-methyltransferase
MSINNNPIPEAKELPSEFAERLGKLYAERVTYEHKAKFGQFFTPRPLARFMSSFLICSKSSIRILDPGCGMGILSCSICEYILFNSSHIKTIELVAFETDIKVLPSTEQAFNYLSAWLTDREINFTYFLCKNDFVLHNSAVLSAEPITNEKYDIVIANPPYFKLPKDDVRVDVARSVVYGQPNIYSIFLLIAARLLLESGRLIFITPRSFCSGSSFRLFREHFFRVISLKMVHLFSSRSHAFKKDNVLQETLVIVAHNKDRSDNFILPNLASSELVEISSSKGLEDLDARSRIVYDINYLVDFSSFQKILHLPVNNLDEQVMSIFKTWNGSLHQYNMEISTGPVVDFRSLDFILPRKAPNTVPLLWLHNITSMKVTWPLAKKKIKTKGQYIRATKESFSRLVPNRNYVMLRRFSSKEDKRRLIAAPFFKSSFSSFAQIGVENHLNYIYKINGSLTQIEATGIAALLNSTVFDLYFRTFNGNTNVSATELRDFPLPNIDLIISLGKQVLALKKLTSESIDTLVSETLNLPLDLLNIYYGEN